MKCPKCKKEIESPEEQVVAHEGSSPDNIEIRIKCPDMSCQASVFTFIDLADFTPFE